MKLRKLKICFIILTMTIMSIVLAVNVAAASKQFTITVRDTDGNPLSGMRVSMRDNYSLDTQVDKVTNANGQVTFTMYDNRTYGFNVYDANHNEMCKYSPNTYTTSSSVIGLGFTFEKASYNYPTYSNPIELNGSTIKHSSYFGYRYYGGLNLHVGLDIAAPADTAIKNVASAYYQASSLTDSYARGYWVLLKISSSRYVLYQHMKYKYNGTTTTTDLIPSGTTVGYVGGTGGSITYANHLHIEFLSDSTMSLDKAVDPLRYIYK